MSRLSWAILVDRDGDQKGCDVGLSDESNFTLDSGVEIRFHKGRLEYFCDNRWVWIAPGTIEYLSGHPYSAVITSIEPPAPAKRPKYRLPGSGKARCVLAVQSGKFRGCFFAVELAPVWLGRGASVNWEPGVGGRYYPGSESSDSPQVLKDGQIVEIGGVSYQYLSL